MTLSRTLLLLTLVSVVLFQEASYAVSIEKKKATILLGSLKSVAGEYEGEVRLQSSDGSINLLIVTQARLNLELSGDEFILRTDTDLLGKECGSKLHSIRELIQFENNQTEMMRATFDFDPGRCFTEFKPDTLLVIVRKDSTTQGLALETLLTKDPYNLEIKDQLKQKKLVHGYFVKTPFDTKANTRAEASVL